jgi:release factor glutamine methyltransferase
VTSVRELLHCAADLPGDSALRDAEVLLCHCADKSRSWLYAWPECEVGSAVADHYRRCLAARRLGHPVAHLTGRREFWSLELEVNAHTLIPRPETETLVEWALQLPMPEDAQVIDLGTGSGAIILALASERDNWHFLGVDSSAMALAVARSNGQRLGLERVRFELSDWFGGVAEERFHLMVGNPPYIEQHDPHLGMGDLRFEPTEALISGAAGLADLAYLVNKAPEHLFPGGWLLLEHGFEQGDAVRQQLQGRGFTDVQTRKDISGQERITGGCRGAE